MKANWKQLVQTAIDYIESEISQKLTLDDVSQAVHLSKYHLHRIVKNVTGRSLADYIRSRKLARSFELLMEPSNRIIDISEAYGFEHEQSYIRAFKSEFGITPAYYRKHSTHSLPITEKMSLTMISNLTEGMIFQPFYVIRPESLLIGKRNKITYIDNEEHYEANSRGNDFYQNDFHRIHNRIHTNVYIGLTHEETDSYTYYLSSAEVSSIAYVPEGLVYEVLPTNQYAVFRYIGNLHPGLITIDHLNEIWDFIDYYWKSHSGYEKVGRYYFEYIDGDLARDDYGELDIYIPVRLIE